jgi:5-enolpyruvylshikimate-3-phosphate synthase
MLEKAIERARLRGAERARRHARRLAQAAAEAAPAGVAVEESGDGFALAGPGLKRRLALEPALRWLVERVR